MRIILLLLILGISFAYVDQFGRTATRANTKLVFIVTSNSSIFDSKPASYNNTVMVETTK